LYLEDTRYYLRYSILHNTGRYLNGSAVFAGMTIVTDRQ